MYDPLMKDILSKLNSVSSQPTKSTTSLPQENSSDMLDILKRFDLAESGASKLTPVNVKHGLNKQQKAVGQVGPEFKPKTTKVLTAPTDPKNPFAGKLVGGSESRRNNKPMIDEAEVSEDLLSDIKKSLNDYLKQIDTIEKVDSDLKNKDRKDTDLKKKDKRDRDFIIRKVKEDPTQQNPVVQPKAPGLINPTYADSGASQTPTINTDVAQNLQTVGESLKTMKCHNGKVFEIFGDEKSGFGVRHNGKFSPSRFRTFLEADTALELFAQRMKEDNRYKPER